MKITYDVDLTAILPRKEDVRQVIEFATDDTKRNMCIEFDNKYDCQKRATVYRNHTLKRGLYLSFFIRENKLYIVKGNNE